MVALGSMSGKAHEARSGRCAPDMAPRRIQHCYRGAENMAVDAVSTVALQSKMLAQRKQSSEMWARVCAKKHV